RRKQPFSRRTSVVSVLRTTCTRRCVGPPEPNFPPVQEIAPVTSAEGETSTVAKHIFQHDCILEMFHLACSFCDEVIGATSYAVSSAAERTHVRAEVQP